MALVAVEVGTGGEFAGDGDVACAVALGVGVYCGPERQVESLVGEEGRGVERPQVGHNVARWSNRNHGLRFSGITRLSRR